MQNWFFFFGIPDANAFIEYALIGILTLFKKKKNFIYNLLVC